MGLLEVLTVALLSVIPLLILTARSLMVSTKPVETWDLPNSSTETNQLLTQTEPRKLPNVTSAVIPNTTVTTNGNQRQKLTGTMPTSINMMSQPIHSELLLKLNQETTVTESEDKKIDEIVKKNSLIVSELYCFAHCLHKNKFCKLKKK